MDISIPDNRTLLEIVIGNFLSDLKTAEVTGPPLTGPPLTAQQIWDFSTPSSTMNFITDRRWNMSYILHPDQLPGTGKPSQSDLDFGNLLSERLRSPHWAAERIWELSEIPILDFQILS